MRINWTRADFTPKGATKVSAKDSTAVVYISNSRKPHAVGFAGKAQKPIFNYSFKDEAARAAYVAKFFASIRASEVARKERRAKHTAPHTLQVGHILVASWGYDQTNIDYFQVTRIVGKHTVELRAIGQTTLKTTGHDSGTCMPVADQFHGEPMIRRAAANSSIKIDDVRRARLWDCRPDHWSSGH